MLWYADHRLRRFLARKPLLHTYVCYRKDVYTGIGVCAKQAGSCCVSSQRERSANNAAPLTSWLLLVRTACRLSVVSANACEGNCLKSVEESMSCVLCSLNVELLQLQCKCEKDDHATNLSVMRSHRSTMVFGVTFYHSVCVAQPGLQAAV